MQSLDGVGAGIFGALFPVVVADLTRGTGPVQRRQGAVASVSGPRRRASRDAGRVDHRLGRIHRQLPDAGGDRCGGLRPYLIAMPETSEGVIARQTPTTARRGRGRVRISRSSRSRCRHSPANAVATAMSVTKQVDSAVGRQAVIFLVIDQPVPQRDRQIGITRPVIDADCEAAFARYPVVTNLIGPPFPTSAPKSVMLIFLARGQPSAHLRIAEQAVGMIRPAFSRPATASAMPRASRTGRRDGRGSCRG